LKLVEFLIDEEIVLEDEPTSTIDVIELRKLRLQDNEKECKVQLRMKEMELQKQELAMQLELELTAAHQYIHQYLQVRKLNLM